VKTQVDSGGLKWLWQRYTYDDADRQLTASTSGGSTGLEEGNRQIEGQVDSTTVTVTNAYDSAGNLLSVTRQTVPDSNKIGTVTTSWTYDEANRHTKEIAPDGKGDSMAYDAAGNVVSWTTRRGGAPIVTTYDALNRRLQHFVPPVFYPETTFVDSVAPAPFAVMYPDTGYTHSLGFALPGDWATYTYDIEGNLTGAVNGDAIVRRTYNTNGTLRTDSLRIRTYADLADGGDTTSHRYGQTFGYDIEGRRLWMHVDSILAPRVSGVVKDTIHYAYDSVIGSLATVTDVMGSTWRYAYDAGGRIDSTFFPGSGLEVQTFDGEGRDSTRVDRLTSVLDTINDDLVFHDARDHIIHVRTPFDTTVFRYTPLGAVAVTAEQNQDGGHENQQFNMDGLGNMFQELSDFFQFGSLHTYLYEPHTGRLRGILAPSPGMQAVFDTSTYDPAGNRHWQVKYDFFAPGWSSQAPYAQEFSFNYYSADNTLRVVDRNECYLQPNAANCTPNPSGNFAGAYEEYRYDALGRRILVRTRRDHWCLITTGCYHTMTRTIWDGDQVLFEVRVPAWSSVSADTLEADTTFIGGQTSAYGPYGRVLYTHGLGLDSPLGVVRLGYSFGDGATNWNGPQDLVLYRNWRGIPNAGTWTDGTTSAHCSSIDPSLCVLIRYPATSTTTFFEAASTQPDSGWFGTLTTQDPDGSGELYKRNRYYDPTQGRFTQEDPIGLAGGLNAYGFANGDPITYSDPFGLCGEKGGQPCPVLFGGCPAISDACDSAPLGQLGVDHPKLAIAGGLTLVGASFGEAIADAVELGAGLYKTVRKAFESHSAPLASNITKKISRQLGRRGWSAGDIDQTVNSPFTTRPSINRATGNRATAFYREDGSYVVRDDGTGDIVQISDRKSPSSWKPDRDVQNPYRP
jgi:RHS repeat-associated protein